jgi:signal-transduction protein with cAMP-binding, CBS, and nucleotidyltransferase domain
MMKLTDKIDSILKQKSGEVWSVCSDQSVYEAIEISERDYARKVILKRKSSKRTPVKEIMTSAVVSVTQTHTVDECMTVMTNHRIRHLPVMDGNRVVGLVSIGDLVKWIISQQGETIEQLEHYIAGQYPA